MQTTLYLARHGETVWNTQQRFQGQLDSELTTLGQQQARQVAEKLSDKAIELIISSNLGRAVATAAICQQKLQVVVETEHGLSERHLGDWQGLSLAQLETADKYNEVLRKFSDYAPNGGESAIKCGERIHQAMTVIAQQAKHKNVLVIVHGEALRCFLFYIGHHFSGNAYHLFKNGCLLQLTYLQQTAQFQSNLLPVESTSTR